jgi:hypothetical protein
MSKPLTAHQLETIRHRAQEQHPDFDWKRYGESLTRESSAARRSLGDDRGSRRLGTTSIPPEKDTRTEIEKMTDKAIVQQGKALTQAAWESEDQVRQAVIAAYRAGNVSLNEYQVKAVAAVAYSMQLDPSPGVGHLYAWFERGALTIAIGYQGYMFKAKQQHEFYIQDTRAMTAEERSLHGLNPGDVGAICELIDMRQARMAKEIGTKVPVIRGSAVWRKEVRYFDKKSNSWKTRSDNVPSGRSPFWVASKNATKDAIRQLGIGFGSMVIPTVPGYAYDRETDSFSEINGEDVIEGEATTVEPLPEPRPAPKSNGQSPEATTVEPPPLPRNRNRSDWPDWSERKMGNGVRRQPEVETPDDDHREQRSYPEPRSVEAPAAEETTPAPPPEQTVADPPPGPQDDKMRFVVDEITVKKSPGGRAIYRVTCPDTHYASNFSRNLFREVGYTVDEWTLDDDQEHRVVKLDPPARVTVGTTGKSPMLRILAVEQVDLATDTNDIPF